MEKDNEDKTLVKPEWLEVRKAEVVEIIVDGVDLLEEVRKSKVKDDEVVKAVEEMKQAGVKMLRDEEWREIDGIMYKEGKVYIPKDNKLRAEIIRLHCKGDWAQDSRRILSNITACGYDTTHLQENP